MKNSEAIVTHEIVSSSSRIDSIMKSENVASACITSPSLRRNMISKKIAQFQEQTVVRESNSKQNSAKRPKRKKSFVEHSEHTDETNITDIHPLHGSNRLPDKVNCTRSCSLTILRSSAGISSKLCETGTDIDSAVCSKIGSLTNSSGTSLTQSTQPSEIATETVQISRSPVVNFPLTDTMDTIITHDRFKQNIGAKDEEENPECLILNSSAAEHHNTHELPPPTLGQCSSIILRTPERLFLATSRHQISSGIQENEFLHPEPNEFDISATPDSSLGESNLQAVDLQKIPFDVKFKHELVQNNDTCPNSRIATTCKQIPTQPASPAQQLRHWSGKYTVEDRESDLADLSAISIAAEETKYSKPVTPFKAADRPLGAAFVESEQGASSELLNNHISSANDFETIIPLVLLSQTNPKVAETDPAPAIIAYAKPKATVILPTNFRSFADPSFHSSNSNDKAKTTTSSQNSPATDRVILQPVESTMMSPRSSQPMPTVNGSTDHGNLSMVDLSTRRELVSNLPARHIEGSTHENEHGPVKSSSLMTILTFSHDSTIDKTEHRDWSQRGNMPQILCETLTNSYPKTLSNSQSECVPHYVTKQTELKTIISSSSSGKSDGSGGNTEVSKSNFDGHNFKNILSRFSSLETADETPFTVARKKKVIKKVSKNAQQVFNDSKISSGGSLLLAEEIGDDCHDSLESIEPNKTHKHLVERTIDVSFSSGNNAMGSGNLEVVCETADLCRAKTCQSGICKLADQGEASDLREGKLDFQTGEGSSDNLDTPTIIDRLTKLAYFSMESPALSMPGFTESKLSRQSQNADDTSEEPLTAISEFISDDDTEKATDEEDDSTEILESSCEEDEIKAEDWYMSDLTGSSPRPNPLWDLAKSWIASRDENEQELELWIRALQTSKHQRIDDHQMNEDHLHQLKLTAQRLHLSTGHRAFSRSDNVSQLSPSARPGKLKLPISEAVVWLQSQLLEMRQLDQSLARQLLALRHQLHEVKLKLRCAQNRGVIWEAVESQEEEMTLRGASDLPPHPLDPKLKELGVTRMNLTSRRFSVF